MTTADVEVLPLPRPQREQPAVESEVVAMVIFVYTEVMFFAGLLSAYTIISGQAWGGVWPPPGDPALPTAATGVGTVALLLSGVAVFRAGTLHPTAPDRALTLLRVAAALAAAFVVWQVVEAVDLARRGFTLVSNAHGGFFYTIVGAHALHALVAVVVLALAIGRLSAGRMTPALFRAVRIFWYFVVGLWPILYAVLYL